MEKDIKPKDIMTRKSFENALTILMILGGSTNATLHLIAMARAADSYCHIHKALSAFLEGSLTYSNPIHAGKRSTNRSSRACFQNPVEHDVLDSVGEKIAGAGQRRTKLGMLHQGSVITLKNIKHGFDYLLAKHAMKKDFSPDTTEYIEKYLDQKWIERR